MSCTVVAVPYALMWVVGAVTTAVASAAASANMVNNVDKSQEIDIFQLNNNENCDEDRVLTESHFIEKDFETPFMDKNILIKTLSEHGVENITETGDEITATAEGYTLTFTKYSEDKPYSLRISCNKSGSAEEKAVDLNNEYAMNVQEDAYLHIIEKLKENNMQIEEEVVQDDNTIVLTVNINN